MHHPLGDLVNKQDITWARTLDGSEYMPGLVGLNDMRANDYANVIIQVGRRCASLLLVLFCNAVQLASHWCWMLAAL